MCKRMVTATRMIDEGRRNIGVFAIASAECGRSLEMRK